MSKLRSDAHSQLRTGFPQNWTDQRVVQILEMPSFHPWTSWTLYRKRSKASSPGVLVEAVWRLDADSEKFRDPVTRLRYPPTIQPTISVDVRSVAEDLLLFTVGELRELVVPVNPGPAPLLLDGTTFEMTAGDNFAVVTYRWSSSPPDGWLPLHGWASRWIARIRNNAIPAPSPA